MCVKINRSKHTIFARIIRPHVLLNLKSIRTKTDTPQQLPIEGIKQTRISSLNSLGYIQQLILRKNKMISTLGASSTFFL